MSARVTGLVVLVALLAVVAVVGLRGGAGVQRVDVVLEQAHGLVRGAEVRAGGERVGTVQAIRLDRGRPRVTLELDSGLRLRSGARADLRLGSLSGQANRYVAVVAGRGPVLPDGAVLRAGATSNPVEVEQVLATLDPATRADVQDVLQGLRTATAGRGADGAVALRRAAGALHETALAAGDVAADGRALRELVRASRQVTGALAADEGATGAAIDDLRALLDATAARQGALADAVRELPEGLRAGRRALARLQRDAPALDRLVADLAPGAAELPGTAGELRRALDAGAPVLRDARRVVARGPGSLRAARPLLEEARPFATGADRVLERAQPVLGELRVRIPDVFSFFANWADFTANYDANGHGARVGLVLPPAPLREIGGSDSGAGHLEAPFVRTPGVLEGEPWDEYRTTLTPREAGG